MQELKRCWGEEIVLNITGGSGRNTSGDLCNIPKVPLLVEGLAYSTVKSRMTDTGFTLWEA